MFKNTPNEHKGQEQEETKTNWVWQSFSAGWKILLVLLILGFLGYRLFVFGQSVVSIHQELFFAYSHPDLVKPIRNLYEKGHEKADADLKQILAGGKE